MQNAHKSALGPRQRMINKGVIAGNIDLELGDDGATGRHHCRLNAPQRLAGHAAEIVDLVEYLPDDMERRREVRTADAEIDANGLAHLCLHRMELGQRTDRPVKHKVFGTLVQQLLDVELLTAVLAECAV